MLLFKINEKSWFSQITVQENGIQFSICDLTDLLTESLTNQEILKRAGAANNTRIKERKPVLDKFEEPANEYVLEDSSEGIVKLILKYSVEEGGRPFKFFFNLKKCSPEEFSVGFSNPLLKYVLEQELKLKELKEIIVAKDKEIDQYKMSGAQLILESAETEKYCDKDFEQKWSEFKETKDDRCNFNLPKLLSSQNSKNLCAILSIQNVFDISTAAQQTNASKPSKKSPSGANKRRKLLINKGRIAKKQPKLEFNESADLDDEEIFAEPESLAIPVPSASSVISNVHPSNSTTQSNFDTESQVPSKKSKTLTVLRELGI